MKKYAIAMITILSTTWAFQSARAEGPQVGQPAPAFTLKDTKGREHSLSDFKGKVVVLEWVNHGCPFVKKFYSVGEMQKLQKEAVEQGVVWLSICSSAPGKQGHMSPEQWNQKNAEVGFAGTAVLIDEDGKVGRQYNARTTPEMFVINAEGNIVYMGAIDSIRSTKSEDIAKSKNYVRAALAALKAGKAPEVTQTQPYGCSVKYAD